MIELVEVVTDRTAPLGVQLLELIERLEVAREYLRMLFRRVDALSLVHISGDPARLFFRRGPRQFRAVEAATKTNRVTPIEPGHGLKVLIQRWLVERMRLAAQRTQSVDLEFQRVL